MRVIIGLVKGLIVGGAVGYGLLRLGWTSGVLAYVACAIVGAVVGVVAGRAPWKAETIWTPVLKMIVGAAIGVGLAALGTHFGPDSEARACALPLGTDLGADHRRHLRHLRRVGRRRRQEGAAGEEGRRRCPAAARRQEARVARVNAAAGGGRAHQTTFSHVSESLIILEAR
jgi:hypothetical protein